MWVMMREKCCERGPDQLGWRCSACSKAVSTSDGEKPDWDCDCTPPDLRGPAAIVDGSVIGGFTFTGPFDTIDAAHQWHEKRTLAGWMGLAPTAIVLLANPEDSTFRVCDSNSVQPVPNSNEATNG